MSAAPSPATASFTSFGEYWATSAPAATASAMARPLAWPTAMAVRTFTWKKTRSIATTSARGSAHEDPQLGLQLGQPERQRVGGSVRRTPMAVQRGPVRPDSTHA